MTGQLSGTCQNAIKRPVLKIQYFLFPLFVPERERLRFAFRIASKTFFTKLECIISKCRLKLYPFGPPTFHAKESTFILNKTTLLGP